MTQRSVAIVGAGPAGLYLGMGLARRGDRVTIVDRDAGPDQDGGWTRKGVMQFLHPHYLRPQVRDALLAELPDVADALVEAGAVLTPGMSALPRPGWSGAADPTDLLGYRVRRSVFERVLRQTAADEPGVSFSVGAAREVAQAGGVVHGVVVGDTVLEADLVIDASGRSGRFTDDLRAPAEGTDSGIAYASRQYELLPGAEPGPFNSPPGWRGVLDGYFASIFYQDARTFQILYVRAAADKALAHLRDSEIFDKVSLSIPGLQDWISPDRAKPVLPAMSGAGLYDHYRRPVPAKGSASMAGILWLGDAVVTTNPAEGRGVTTALLQAQQLLAILDDHGSDYVAVSERFDHWCQDNMRPWVMDHIHRDTSLLARWRGEPIDLSQRLPSDLVCAVAEVEPSLIPAIDDYLDMRERPDVLDEAEPIARKRYQAGFRPKVSAGPTRDEVADMIERHLAVAG
ncbi:FAD-dependent oxidoreductase [Kribbella sp. NPDC051620]|uniref:FAD-dependent oxidoreductase n=1 Tax=Kribbella sp. NPDC051620 TaxID=3364120 RepID=UPI0037BA3A1F